MKEKVKIIAEIGINHNGSLELAKKLIDVASLSGCDYVKFQKRTPELCVPEEQKNKVRKTPWGEMTYMDYKNKIEFGKDEYDEIDSYCSEKKIKWFASAWDKPSVDFLKNYTDITKIGSALITDLDLCSYARENNRTLLVSTGMSSEEEVEKCILVSNPDVIMHTNSTYPTPIDEINLEYINWLKNKWSNKEIGYSGHEFGLVTTFAAVAMGCGWIERHITLDRNMWGSDQMASVEPQGVIKLVKGIRDIERAFGNYGLRVVKSGELSKKESLRSK